MRFIDYWRRFFVVCVWLAAFHSWVASAEFELIGSSSTWRFLAGNMEASGPDTTHWRDLGFDDVGWEPRAAAFYYGETGYTGSDLVDMQGNYSSFFLRKTFVVADPASVRDLSLRAICDDGFAAWINGRLVASLNPPLGEPHFNSVAGNLANEPVAYAGYVLPSPAGYLVPGTNVMAVQVFNASSGSSDIVFDSQLVAEFSGDTPPFVVSVSPEPGRVTSLERIHVVFSEPVTGVAANDLMLNAVGAVGVSGNDEDYLFQFDPPPQGSLQITWNPDHHIQSVAPPVRALDPTGPGMNWHYELVPAAGPVIVGTHPPPGIRLRGLAEVSVTFDQGVQGVLARDLLVNGIPAVGVDGLGAGPYRFRFLPAGEGMAEVTWAEDQSITGVSPYAPSFQATGWNYIVDRELELTPVIINEIMAENVGGVTDEDGEAVDWIELYNPGTQAVELRGWGLTDDLTRPHQWVFPDVTLPAGGFLVLYASGKDRRSPGAGAFLHTNFKLSIEGEYLGLYGPDTPAGAVSELAPKYAAQRPGSSYGRQPDGVWGYFTPGTPGVANGTSLITNVVADVHFNVSRCTFNRPFDLWLSCATPGATIHYTLDGSTPTETVGLVYRVPLRMQRTGIVRAAGFKPRHLPSVTDTHTYIYYPSTHLRFGPVLSLATDANHLYGENGIMEYSPRNTTKHGVAWERPVSFEYLTPDGEGSFQVDCGIRVAGGGYVRGLYNYDSNELPWNKYSFRLYFRGDYGAGRLRYPLFPDTTVEDFNTITLRAGMNDPTNPFLRDEMVRQLAADVGQVASRGSFGSVYLNGRAVGLYNPCERIDGDFLRTYHGGTNEWDLLGSMSEQLEGDAIAWNALRTTINTHDLAVPSNYLEVSRQLDLVNFIDYLLPQVYADNDDWPHNNWRAARERVPEGKFRFYIWDAEWAFGYQGHAPSHDTIANQLSNTSPPWGSSEIQSIFNGLKVSPEFRLLFADRVHRHLFNDGALTDARIKARYEKVKARVAPAISGFDDTIGTTWIPQRRPHLLNHLAAAGFLASAKAPALRQFGGRVPAGWELTMSAAIGEIYYTTDGTDPRVMFTGTAAPTALRYIGGVHLEEDTRIKARTLEGNTWSALSEALFSVTSVGPVIAFTEIMYHPVDGEAYEFIELLNTGGVALDLANYTLDGVEYRFPAGGTWLEAGQRIVLGSSANPAAFALRYPGVALAGVYKGSLANEGERLALRNPTGTIVAEVTYDDDPPWPVEPDGDGSSLERTRLDGDPDDPASWQASSHWGGSPGAPAEVGAVPSVRISEVFAVGQAMGGVPAPDWIELHNPGAAMVDLSGWSLTDNSDPLRFVFPAMTLLPGDGRLMIWCDTAQAGGLHTGFGLDNRGESIALYDSAGARVDVVTFGQQAAGFSIGRVGVEGDWTLTEPTPGALNEPALLGSVRDLVINEMLAHAGNGEEDWLELYNRDDQRPVSLFGLQVEVGNNSYQNRALSFVAPGGYGQWIADGEPGAAHLGLRLPSEGAELVLRDATGSEIDRVHYDSQSESVSCGRLPDGSDNWLAFPDTASPGAANYVVGWSGPLLNEFMARNQSTLVDLMGERSDWLELYNPGTVAFDLAGMSLNVRRNEAGSWIFPPASIIAPTGHLLVWCTDHAGASTVFSADMNVGAPLGREGGGIYLFNAAGQLVDSVEYGFQIEDRSVGRAGGVWGLLAEPTPGSMNSGFAALGDPTRVRFNEWLAASNTEADWFELYNPSTQPVSLSASFLTDHPAVASQTKYPIGPLTFMPPQGFVRWIADGQTQAGPDHVNFSLDALGEMIRLNTNAVYLTDALYIGPQMTGVSEGRLPDGQDRIVRFPKSPTPGSSNYLPLSDIVINEVLSHSDPPLEDAIEIRNLGTLPAQIGGWYLSNDEQWKFRVPSDTTVPAGGYCVFYEHQFNPQPGEPGSFGLNSAHGDAVNLFETDSAGASTGRRAAARFGPAANGVSFGRVATSLGVDYASMVGRTFGKDQPVDLIEFRQGHGGQNTVPLVGPVVISEIMYHPSMPPGSSDADEAASEYLEMFNGGDASVALFDPVHPANRWRLRGGVEFTFPTNTFLAAQEVLVVVAFDPVRRPDLEAAFLEQYGVPFGVSVIGPYAAALSNAGEQIGLVRPDTPQSQQQPEAGYVPYLVVDEVQYLDDWPWSAEADGTGLSLQRRAPHLYGNEPLNWEAALPTAGRVHVETLETDSDRDGLPDAWEEEHGFDPGLAADAARDDDADGQNTLAEYWAGTDPRDREDVLELQFQRDRLAYRFRFIAKPGRSYSLQVPVTTLSGESG